jgi:hypothetical protein
MKPSTNLAMQIEWDDSDKKQVEEAKKIYQHARMDGRLIVDFKGNAIANFHPSLLGFIIKETELKEHEFAVRVLDETGDRRLIWDASDPSQVCEAVKLFDEYLSKGWRAYSVDINGKRRRKITRFDINTLEVFFIEKTTKEIIANFAETLKNQESNSEIEKSETIKKFMAKFKDTKLVPRTFPG